MQIALSSFVVLEARWGWTARAVGRRRRRIVLLGNLERLHQCRIAVDAHDAPGDVLADDRTLLEPLGIATGRDPDVRHPGVDVNDEVAARRRLVMTGVRLC